jgi:hypothetical protein
VLIVPAVPHEEVKDNTREQARFCDAEEEMGRKKARIVADDPSQC